MELPSDPATPPLGAPTLWTAGAPGVTAASFTAAEGGSSPSVRQQTHGIPKGSPQGGSLSHEGKNTWTPAPTWVDLDAQNTKRRRGRKPAFQDVSPHEPVLTRRPEGRRVAEAVSKAGDTLTRAGAQSALRTDRGQRAPAPRAPGWPPRQQRADEVRGGARAVSPEGEGTRGPHVCRRLWAEGSLCPGSLGGPGKGGEAEVGPGDLLPGEGLPAPPRPSAGPPSCSQGSGGCGHPACRPPASPWHAPGCAP